MRTIDLCGDWTLSRGDGTEEVPAVVPGCVHTDLLAAGRIEDPFFRDNETALQWIGETDWIYARSFAVDAELLSADAVLLQADGLDTLAEVRINDKLVGRTDNMFRAWQIDVRSRLVAGDNRISIRFHSTFPMMRAQQAMRYLHHTGIGAHRIEGGNRVRKCQCQYGWDWGPKLVTAGIWRPIRLAAWTQARIADLRIAQVHSRGRVDLEVSVAVEAWSKAQTRVEVTASCEGATVASQEVEARRGAATARLRIDEPKLWWPNGMGGQPLYQIAVRLLDGQGTTVDGTRRVVGLRTLRLERKPDAWGESFQFVVNGRPFFAKGANWIPADSFVTRVAPAQYEDLVQAAADANMNMLRVWGGGIYEADLFYDLCDEQGHLRLAGLHVRLQRLPRPRRRVDGERPGRGRGHRQEAAPPRLSRPLVREQRDRADQRAGRSRRRGRPDDLARVQKAVRSPHPVRCREARPRAGLLALEPALAAGRPQRRAESPLG